MGNRTYELIVIGGGPGGLATAIEGRYLGISDTLILEKGHSHSMTIRDYYKDGKRVDKDWKGAKVDLVGNIQFTDGTKETTLELFDHLIAEHQLDIKYRSDVEAISRVDNYFRVLDTSGNVYFAKNVVIAIGSMGKPNKPDYPIPAKIKKVVNFNLEKAQKGEKFLVVGGGNSAVEYALELTNISNDVTLTYRRGRFTRVNPENLHNLDIAVQDGKLKLRTATDIKMLSEENGKIVVHYQHGELESYDRVIYAIGGVVPKEFLKKSGIEIDSKGKPILDSNFQTSVKNLYVVGDLAVQSGGSIALALNHGYYVAKAIANV